MRICYAFDDKNEDDEEEEVPFSSDDYVIDMYTGDCVPVTLRNGTAAQWVSGSTPHTISGLPAGTYYLVEITAPKGYSTAESIKFVMNDDGTLSDGNGKSLANNKIVMKDKPIPDVKTGDIITMVASMLFLIVIGFASYYFFDNKDDIVKKVRNRRVNSVS